MATFRIELCEKLFSTVDVEASSEQEAREIMLKDLAENATLADERSGEYSTGWTIFSIEKA